MRRGGILTIIHPKVGQKSRPSVTTTKRRGRIPDICMIHPREHKDET